jgi:hypothetical protein
MAIFYQASTAEKTLRASFCSIQKLPQLFEETHAAIAGKTVVALTPKCKQRSCKSTHRNGVGPFLASTRKPMYRHRRARAHTLIDGKYTQKHRAEAEAKPLTHRS